MVWTRYVYTIDAESETFYPPSNLTSPGAVFLIYYSPADLQKNFRQFTDHLGFSKTKETTFFFFTRLRELRKKSREIYLLLRGSPPVGRRGKEVQITVHAQYKVCGELARGNFKDFHEVYQSSAKTTTNRLSLVKKKKCIFVTVKNAGSQ